MGRSARETQLPSDHRGSMEETLLYSPQKDPRLQTLIFFISRFYSCEIASVA